MSFYPELDLKDIIHRVASDHPELSPADLALCETEYRRFLFLVSKYPGQPFSPTARADVVWHSHILFTQRYQRDCQTLFGKFLHHRPFTSETPEETKQASVANLRRLYAKHFGMALAADCKECNTDSGGHCDTQACEIETSAAKTCDSQACDTVMCGGLDNCDNHWEGDDARSIQAQFPQPDRHL